MTVKRVAFLQELLSLIGLEDRLHLEWISSAEAQKFARVVTDFTEQIRDMGPCPLSDKFVLPAMEILQEMQARQAMAAQGG